MQTRNKNARNCSRSAKNLQTRNTHHHSPWQAAITHPFAVADRNHSPLPRGRPGSPSTLPPRFNGQGLISQWGPCPLEVPRWPKRGQGVTPEIRPCPSECGLFTLAPFHGLSNHIYSIGLQQKRCRSLQGGVRLVGNAAGRSRTGSYGGAGCGELHP